MSNTNTFDEMCRAVGALIDRLMKDQHGPLDKDAEDDISIITEYIRRERLKRKLALKSRNSSAQYS